MTLPVLDGRVAWVFDQDNFDVDQIVGVKNIKLADLSELAGLAMKSFDPQFSQQVKPGDLLVGGANFGYGHPHYPPLMAMRHLGITCLIAESFAPGFFRGEISMGFPVLTCPGIVREVSRWDRLSVDWHNNSLLNESTGQKFAITPLAQADRVMLEHGGLIGYLKHQQSLVNTATETSS
jgi:3-isopropylmalate/(R)-2-methylmalate dehydratase small subunit